MRNHAAKEQNRPLPSTVASGMTLRQPRKRSTAFASACPAAHRLSEELYFILLGVSEAIPVVTLAEEERPAGNYFERDIVARAQCPHAP
jgi:hypothetical protein